MKLLYTINNIENLILKAVKEILTFAIIFVMVATIAVVAGAIGEALAVEPVKVFALMILIVVRIIMEIAPSHKEAE